MMREGMRVVRFDYLQDEDGEITEFRCDHPITGEEFAFGDGSGNDLADQFVRWLVTGEV